MPHHDPIMESMLQDIAEQPTNFGLHGIAADYAEDAGHHYLSRSLRHMAEHGHHPVELTRSNNAGDLQYPVWSWTRMPGQGKLEGGPLLTPDTPYKNERPHELPGWVGGYMEANDVGKGAYQFGGMIDYPTQRDAHDAYHRAHEHWQRAWE